MAGVTSAPEVSPVSAASSAPAVARAAPAKAARPGPFAEAWERMRAFLFRPFRPGRYVAVALIAFLSTLGEGGCGAHVSLPADKEPSGHDPMAQFRLMQAVERYAEWAKAHVAEIAVAVLAAFLLLTVAGILLALLKAHARFVFLRTCAEGRLAVGEDLRRDTGRAVGLFLWDFCVGLFVAVVLFAVLAAIFVGLVAVGISLDGAGEARKGMMGVVVILGVFVALCVVLAMIVPVALVQFVTHDLVVAIAAREETGILAAWRRCIRLLRAAPGAAAGYLGLRAVAGFGIGMGEGIVGFALSLPVMAAAVIWVLHGGEPSLRAAFVFLAVSIPYFLAVAVLLTLAALPFRVWLRIAGPAFLSASPAAVAPPAGSPRFCGACGADLPDDGRFCGRCGRSLA